MNIEQEYELIQKTIKRIKIEKGIRNKEICERIGIGDRTISYAMNGSKHMLVTTLLSIVKGLGIDMPKFVREMKKTLQMSADGVE